MENGKTYDLPSGAKLFVSVSEYERVMALHDALVAELRGQGVGGLDVVKIQQAIEINAKKRQAAAAGGPAFEDASEDAGLNLIVDRVLAVAGSKAFKTALFACAGKAVYMSDGTEATSVQFNISTPGYGVFDNPACRAKAREDFYDICRAIAEENLRPFGKALFSMFMAHMGKSADTPASSSAQG